LTWSAASVVVMAAAVAAAAAAAAVAQRTASAPLDATHGAKKVMRPRDISTTTVEGLGFGV
jgi:Spy/CpxP family protein refolding chaperone